MRTWLSVLVFTLAGSGLVAQTKTIEKLERDVATKKDTAKINALSHLTRLYLARNLAHADSLARQTQLLLSDLAYPEGNIRTLNFLAYTTSSLGNYDSAIHYSDDAIRESEELGDAFLSAETYLYRYLVLFKKGDYAAAADVAEKALVHAEESGSAKLLAKANDNIGVVHGIKGEHAEAIKYFLKSLEYSEKINDLAAVSLAYNHLGHTFELAQNYEKALEYLGKAVETCEKTNDLYNLGWTMVNLGVVYSRVNRADTALVIYLRALPIAEQLKDQRLLLTCLDNIGGKYTLSGDFKNANKYLRRAYRLSEASGQNSRTVYIMGNLAENHLYMKQYDSARYFGEKQLELALAANLISEQKVAYFNLAQIYDSLNDHRSAYKALLGYIAVNDSIFNREKSDQIETLRETFEAEKKEREIENLRIVNENAQFRNRAYAGAAISFLVLGGLVYYVQRVRTKRNRMLLEKEQEVDRMKSRFFTNISHEFRTPLTLILGPVKTMLADTNDPEQKQQLTVMERNANRLLELVNQLLDLAKIESGTMKLHVTKSDIITVLKGVTLSFHSVMQQKEINLVLDVPDEELIINFDRQKFETILTNLIGNAVKFTPPKGAITVCARTMSEKVRGRPAENIEISVSDTGSGISSDDVTNIFDRFYQSDDSHQRQQAGSGIGLSLSKELVELHGGKISASSIPGIGTQVVFTIPTDIPGDEISLGNPPLPAREESPVYIESPADEATDENKPLVLVIEDHVEVQSYIGEILRERYIVSFAENGEAGIAKAIDIIPDIIISDVMMPKKDGYEVSRTLKNDERTSHIPIILLTAKADSGDKIEGLRTKADDYVTKPFVPDELLARVENLIESRKRLREKYKKESTLRPAEVTENSIDEKFLTRLMELVENNISNEHFGVEQLSREIGMSRSQLHRKLKALLDQGPNQFIRTHRLNRAYALLEQRAATASEIAYRVGFSSPSYFTKCFHEQFGCTPSDVLNKTH